MNRFLKGVDPAVFWGSTLLIAGFVGWGVFAPKSLGTVMSATLGWVIGNFGWWFVLIVFAGLALCIFLVIHPWGNIRLGPDDSRPEFRTFSWISMTFAAGLGAGLLFFGIVEPVSHWIAPPHGAADPRTQEATLTALRYTYFHWGFSGWALYAVMGGAMAYFSFRKGLPTLVSSTLSPVLGPGATEHPVGRIVDALAIVATLFGMATALGLSALQLNSGLDHVFGVPKSVTVAVIIVVVVTILFLVSAVSGVEKGVNFLANMGAFATIGLFVFFLFAGGATVRVISEGIESIGTYLVQVIPMSLQTGVGGDEQWMAGWTIFYWAWWISWAPFVGMFVARLSRGRTIREFVLGVVAAPAGFGFLWFAVVGGTGIELQRSGKADIVGTLATPELSLFTALDALPFPVITSTLCVILIALYFISGSDAAAIVIATMASRGSLEPSRVVVIVLGGLMGGIACAMLLVGGLGALQQAAILGSVPFTLVIVAVAWCWIKALREEPRRPGGVRPPSPDGVVTRSHHGVAAASGAAVPAGTIGTGGPGVTLGTGPGQTGADA